MPFGLMTERDYEDGMKLMESLMHADEGTNELCELEALSMELSAYEDKNYDILHDKCKGCESGPPTMLDEDGVLCEKSGKPGRWSHGLGDGWSACTNPPTEDSNPVPYLFSNEMIEQGLASECDDEDCEGRFVWEGTCTWCGKEYPILQQPDPNQVEIPLAGPPFRPIVVDLESEVMTGAVQFNDDSKGLFIGWGDAFVLADVMNTILDSPDDCELEKRLLKEYADLIEGMVLK
jgi:hypothetical protein